MEKSSHKQVPAASNASIKLGFKFKINAPLIFDRLLFSNVLPVACLVLEDGHDIPLSPSFIYVFVYASAKHNVDAVYGVQPLPSQRVGFVLDALDGNVLCYKAVFTS